MAPAESEWIDLFAVRLKILFYLINIFNFIGFVKINAEDYYMV